MNATPARPDLIDFNLVLRALYDGPAARRLIAKRTGIDVTDGVLSAAFDNALNMLRKSGDIMCAGQSYSLTDAGRLRAIGPVYMTLIMTDKGPIGAVTADKEQAAEVYRRMQVTHKAPAAVLLPRLIGDLSSLPPEYQPGNPDPIPPRVLHTVRFKGIAASVAENDRGAAKVRCIKAIREVTGLGLREAKEVIDGTHGGKITDIADDEMADRLIKAIAAAGGEASWRAEEDRAISASDAL